MFDWTKAFQWVLAKMPWVGVVTLAYFVFASDSFIPEFALAFRSEWRGFAFWMMCPAILITGAWFWEKFWKWHREREKAQKAKREAVLAELYIWNNFTRLSPKAQVFLISLFFSGDMGKTVRLNDPMIVVLRVQGFLVAPPAGVQSMADLEKPMGMVVLSKTMAEYMNRYSRKFQAQAVALKAQLTEDEASDPADSTTQTTAAGSEDMHPDAVIARKYAEGDPETIRKLSIFDP